MMLHDQVHDLTGKDMILGKDEGTLPLVWATVTLFRKTANTEADICHDKTCTGILFTLQESLQDTLRKLQERLCFRNSTASAES